MSEIRLLTVDEIPDLLPGARAFFGEGNLLGELNEAHFVATLQSYLRAGMGFVLAAGNAPDFTGSIAGIVFPDFATGQPRCMEFYWYVHPELRKGLLGVRLLKAFEAEAVKRGAEHVLMMHLVAGEEAKFERFYARCGYTLREQIFAKQLKEGI